MANKLKLVFKIATVIAAFVSASAAYAQTSALSRTLHIGDSGGDVQLLQQLLNQDPQTMLALSGAGSPSQETTYFGVLTRQAVIAFQLKYKDAILVPAGLASPTGIVGIYTRTQLVLLQTSPVTPTTVSPSPGVNPPTAVAPPPQPSSNGLYALYVFRAGYGDVRGPNSECGAECTKIYPAGTTISLTPIPKDGWRFAFWAGACSGSGACNVYMNDSHVVTATFQPFTTAAPLPNPVTPPPIFLPVTPPAVSPTPPPGQPPVATPPTPVTPPAPSPTVISFGAIPGYVLAGEISLLSWNVFGATSVSIDHGIGTVPSVGTKLVLPSQPTTYTLSAYNGATLIERHATILIGTEPVTPPTTPPIIPPPVTPPVTPPVQPPVTPPPVAPPIVATMPGQIINLSNWKLTLPFGGPTEIKQPELATYINSTYFSVSPEGDSVRFRAPINGATTGGSSYPRSELREMTGNGASTASWSSGSGTHTLFVDQAVTALPPKKPWITVGQIHDIGDDVLVIKVRTATASASPTDPVRITVDTGGTTAAILDPNYVLGKRFTVKFVVTGNKTEVYYNGATTPNYTYNKSFSGGYFKVGAYTQSNCSTENVCSSDIYGEVKVYAATVSHT